MESNKISVVVPVYNVAPWLPRCLDSILAQSCPDLEVIVVDDGSQDNGPAIMEEYARADSRVKSFYKPNGGVTSARLFGVSKASGDWIGFVDGDDTIEPEMYQRMLSNALDAGADISHCGYRLIFEDGRMSYFNNSGIRKIQTRQEALKDLLEGYVVGSGLVTKLFRRELFYGLKEQMDMAIRHNEDLLMNYYLFSKADKAILEDVCPYNYIVRKGSASRSGYTDGYLYDPVRVQEIITESIPPENREDALRSRLRGCINTYCLLSAKNEKIYKNQRSDFRVRIWKQKENMNLLPRRPWILGNMICYAPWLFSVIYPLYCKYFQNNRYE